MDREKRGAHDLTLARAGRRPDPGQIPLDNPGERVNLPTDRSYETPASSSPCRPPRRAPSGPATACTGSIRPVRGSRSRRKANRGRPETPEEAPRGFCFGAAKWRSGSQRRQRATDRGKDPLGIAGAEGVEIVFGYPGGAILPAYDAMLDYPVRHVARGGTSRVRPHGRRLRAGQRARGRGHRHLRTGGHEPHHRHRHRDARLDPHRLHHRPGAEQARGQRCLPGDRCHRHHPAHHQAQLAGDRGQGHRPHGARGLRDRAGWPPRARAPRHHQGRAPGERPISCGPSR